MSHNTYYVEMDKETEEWRIEKPKADRASAVFGKDEKAKAIKRAHELAEGGVVHVQGPNGKFKKEQK